MSDQVERLNKFKVALPKKEKRLWPHLTALLTQVLGDVKLENATRGEIAQFIEATFSEKFFSRAISDEDVTKADALIIKILGEIEGEAKKE